MAGIICTSRRQSRENALVPVSDVDDCEWEVDIPKVFVDFFFLNFIIEPSDEQK